MNADTAGRVVVGVGATIAGLQALRYATEEARSRRAVLIAVRAFRSGGTGAGWRDIAREAALAEVHAAFDDAYGGPPEDIEARILVKEGEPGRILIQEATRERDLLVIGGTGVRRIGSLRRAPTARYCARRTVCPVIIVPLPAMARGRSASRLAREAAEGAERLLCAADPHAPTWPEAFGPGGFVS